MTSHCDPLRAARGIALALLLGALFWLVFFFAWSWLLAESPPPDNETDSFTTPAHGLEFLLPDSLIPRADELANALDNGVDMFLPQCKKHQHQKPRQAKRGKPHPCDAAVDRAVIELVDDYRFFCGGQIKYCRGQYHGGGRITMVANPQVGTIEIILQHELCHIVAGPKAGHIAGFSECETPRR